ncbi:MAG: hypothetical protein HOP08_03370 [Cyclobacteriaceae bacterium]|nr:hypothetical protein [Cyclobacteriaceae bacterium]
MNNFFITFHPVFPLWSIALVSAAALIFFIWKEYSRRQNLLIARIIAIVLVIFALLGITLRPALKEEGTGSQSILLTKGYQSSTLDSLRKVYPSIETIQQGSPDIFNKDIRFILGNGLSSDSLEMLDSKSFQFIPGKPSTGIIQWIMPEAIHANRKNTIRGTVNTEQDIRIKITGPAGAEDSVLLKGGRKNFTLDIRPKQAGLFVYQLTTQTNNTKTSDPLPLEVLPDEKLNILVLLKFPSAEIRYLKNYLSAKGHSLSIRYQTSKTNFKYEYANTMPGKISRVTPEIAAATDLVFIDSSVLSELSDLEKSVLKKAIQSGLGMIILDLPEKGNSLKQFLSVESKVIATDTVHLQLDDRNYTLPAQPLTVANDASINAITNHHERMMSGYQYMGAGKVGFQLLKETYRMTLEGNEDDYASLWAPLIEQTSRIKNQMFRMRMKNSFPYYENESLQFEIITSGTRPIVYADGISIPLAEDVLLDDVWSGRLWAGKKGWHQLFIKEDSTRFNYYVSGKGEWNSLRVNDQITKNKFATSTATLTASAKTYQYREISMLWFYLIFLMASGFLWLAPKL